MSKKKKKSRIKLSDICAVIIAVATLISAIANLIQALKCGRGAKAPNPIKIIAHRRKHEKNEFSNLDCNMGVFLCHR